MNTHNNNSIRIVILIVFIIKSMANYNDTEYVTNNQDRLYEESKMLNFSSIILIVAPFIAVVGAAGIVMNKTLSKKVFTRDLHDRKKDNDYESMTKEKHHKLHGNRMKTSYSFENLISLHDFMKYEEKQAVSPIFVTDETNFTDCEMKSTTLTSSSLNSSSSPVAIRPNHHHYYQMTSEKKIQDDNDIKSSYELVNASKSSNNHKMDRTKRTLIDSNETMTTTNEKTYEYNDKMFPQFPYVINIPSVDGLPNDIQSI